MLFLLFLEADMQTYNIQQAAQALRLLALSYRATDGIRNSRIGKVEQIGINLETLK